MARLTTGQEERPGELTMSRLVFVHGIGGPRDSECEFSSWLGALLEGARRAGHSQWVSAVERGRGPEIRFANYSDLFSAPQSQGGGAEELDEREAEILAGLLLEVIDVQAIGASEEPIRRRLAHARAELQLDGEAQGAGDLVRRAINAATTLMGIGPLRRGGQWIAGQFLVGELAQVARYLARSERDGSGQTLDARIRGRVGEAFEDGPLIIVAHSLGTVVCLEALHHYTGIVSLFVTLGSPMALRTVVLPRLVPSPPSTPESVRNWLNFWDRDDIIAARPYLEADIGSNSLQVAPRSARVDSDGLWVHTATKYLTQTSVAGPIAEALGRIDTPGDRIDR
jgi:pimeloyl-ACP methyl ester carboxylesterase